MQELKAFNEKRAEIYWWFSSLFAKELTEAELEQYQSPEIRGFLAGLGENPTLKPAVDRLVDALIVNLTVKMVNLSSRQISVTYS
ncbi:chaperone protein TorD [Vibrio ponticus]|nr:chaperone protein TorD [Vibrio ponticus]